MVHVVATRATDTQPAIRADGSPLAIVRYGMESLEESAMREAVSRNL
jgi:hypothetical protein